MSNTVINILQLLGSVNRGGTEILVYDICKNYPKELGLQHLISYKGGDLENDFINAGIRYTNISKGFLGIKLIFTLRKYIRENKIDIIHVHKTLDIFYVKLAVVGLNIKIIQTLHSLGSSCYYRSMRYFAGIIASKTLFVSEDLFNIYKKRYKIRANYSVLYNGLDYKKLKTNSSSLRKELNLSENAILAAMIGNFNYGRDHYTLCQALKALNMSEQNLHFAFVGGAQKVELYNKCFEYCKINSMLSNVHFLGIRKDIAEILFNIDLFVYSSSTDTFGIAVVESMMSGTPVIVNDLPVFKEITNDGKYALLYQTKNVDDLANKIRYFLNNPDERKQLGDAGKNWAMENFTIEKHIAQLNQIYQGLLHA